MRSAVADFLALGMLQITERLAFNAVQAARGTFDWFTGYGPNMTEAKWLQRILFLETVAGVPGMVRGCP